MSTSYYERTPALHLDGSPIFKAPADEQSEQEVAALLAARWRCELHSFGRLAAVDWYAVRDGRLVALLELKTRSHAAAQYPTVFLNVRKWLALTLAAAGLGAPALFVVRFTDALCWVPVAAIDATRPRVAGCTRSVKSRSDVEPVIDVPVSLLRALT